MKRPSPRTVAPPFPGPVVYGELLEVICEEDKAGRPLAPLVDLLSPRAPDDREQERAEPAESPKVPPTE